MKKRYSYALLFLVPGFFATLLVVGAASAVLFGALWLYVFGDDSWPAWTERVIPVVLLLAFSCLWAGTVVAGYVVGKRLESVPGFNPRHLWLSLAATALPIAILTLHQLSVGNLGPKSDAERCSDYCGDLGYAMSGMPPRNAGEPACQCLGDKGEVQRTVPLEALAPSAR